MTASTTLLDRVVPRSMEERIARRLARSERRIAVGAERPLAAAVQRANIFTASVGPFNGLTTLASADLQIPSSSSIVLVQWRYASQQTVAGDTFYTHLDEATDFAGGVPLQSVSNGGVALVNHRPLVPWIDAATNTVNGMTASMNLFDPYFTQQATPTPGARTYTLKMQRTAGTGNITVTNVFFNVIVL